MKDLKVTTIQSQLHWENVDANLQMFAQKLKPLSAQTDLIILPEMFTTGFSMNAKKLAEDMNGQTMDWLAKQAQLTNAVITGSFIAHEKGNYYNRLIWMRPDSTYSVYDKRHLFTLAKEQDYYTSGQQKLIVEINGWKVCPLICYDLRFPVWSRNIEHYDLLIYVANFPERRSYAWKQLLIARAIENQVYTIGVNRVGLDGKEISYAGDTSVIDFSGRLFYQISNQEDIFTTTLSFEKQIKFREKLNFLPDKDDFIIRNP